MFEESKEDVAAKVAEDLQLVIENNEDLPPIIIPDIILVENKESEVQEQAETPLSVREDSLK